MTPDAAIAAGMEAQLAAWRRRLAAGERRVGWKIALNVPAVQRSLGISEPAIGHLTSASLLDPAVPYSVAGATFAAAEPEIAIRIGTPVPPDADESLAKDAIVGLAAAIEIVDVNLPFEDLTRILAENVFHRRVFFSAEHNDVTPGDLEGVAAAISTNGTEAGRADAGEAARGLVETVRHVGRVLGRFGERLEQGDVVIAGSLTAPVPVRAGDQVSVEIGPLGGVAARL